MGQKDHKERLTGADLTLSDIVGVILGDLGGSKGPIHVEDITHACYQQYPARFCYSKYPNHMNMEVTRTTLIGLGRKKHVEAVGETLRDTQQAFWQLTDAGSKWYAENSESIRAAMGMKSPFATKNANDKKHFDAAKSALNRSKALRLWNEGKREEIKVWDFFDALRADPLVQPNKMRDLLTNLELAVAGDPNLQELVRYLDERFSKTYRAESKVGV